MNLEKASVQLSYLLRHSKDPMYVTPEGGWANVEEVLAVLRNRFPEMDRQKLETIVAEDKKGRYSFSLDGLRIRANQGHSIPGVTVEMESPKPPKYLYHGTATRFLDAIRKEGLKPMTRQFVHLSAAYDTAVTVGKRHGAPVVLTVRAADFVEDGNGLWLSANGVWQAKAVPPEYLMLDNE